MKYDILCVGDATLDIIMAGIPEDIFSRDSTLASTSKWLVGGDAANQACTFDALGMKTALTAKIGTDLVGNTIYQMLSESTIDLSYMIRTPDKVSGYCVAVVQPNGQRCFLLSMGDGDRDLKPEEIDFSVLDETCAVSVGSLFCLYEMDIRGTRMLFEAARKKGVLTFADMTGDSFKIGPQALNDIYPFTDYLLPSLEEGIYVTGKSDPGEIAQWFLDHGVSNVLVKLGEKGCFFKNATEAFYTPAFSVDAIDTTGCGDNFSAAFITSLLQGKTAAEAIRFGNAAGAINATGIGAHGNVKSYEQVKKFLDEHTF